MQKISELAAMAGTEGDQRPQKWDELNEFVESRLALLAMGCKLPQDVLGEIFKLLLPPNGRSSITVTRVDSPLQLSHVCRDWRSLALSMPSLWAGMDIVVDTAPRDPATYVNRVNDALKAWLSRSGLLPLSISIIWTSQGFGSCSLLMETLKAVSLRWRHMRFSLPSYDFFFSPLRHIAPKDVPVLRSVVIDIRDAAETLPSYPSQLGFLPFLKASNIRDVSVKTYPANFYRYPLDWENLRNLSLGSRIRDNSAVAFMQALPTLRRCVNLETLTMPVYDYLLDGVPPTVPLRLENLQRVAIIDSLNNTIFFERTDLPNLRHLEYHSIIGRFVFVPHLSAPERLTSLSLHTPLSADHLQECLRFLPRVQNLVIRWERPYVGTFHLFPFLIPHPDDPHGILSPELQHLCCVGVEDGSDEELLEMILARARADVPLAAVDMTFFSREREMDIVPHLRPLIDQGLSISLRYDATTANVSRGCSQFADSHDERRRVDPGASEWDPISEDWTADYSRWGLE
ncbi:hypothetical protein DFH07DRAFT_850643 [Mycena maculata]|uniref:F-box domain-containing protein n=1 Tax=Mycena maculata TaxID=230809 RepID=A0AAD7HUY5_9AGAR|nr:hypothetical protein DFH07DRAFT_850643 [Mycena maculata]